MEQLEARRRRPEHLSLQRESPVFLEIGFCFIVIVFLCAKRRVFSRHMCFAGQQGLDT